MKRKIMISYLMRLDNIIDLNVKTKIFQDHDTLTQQQQVNFIIILVGPSATKRSIDKSHA